VRRRDFITLLSGAAAWPLAARAQQTDKLPIVGFLGANATAWRSRIDAFVRRLRELGWIEGSTIAIEYRWDEGSGERDTEIANEFVRMKPAVIVTVGSLVAPLKQVTSAIPIVFVLANDPVGSGLVASLSRPGGNITGLSSEGPDIASKRVELLRSVVPRLRRLAILADSSYPAALRESGEVQTAAWKIGIEPKLLEVRKAEEIASALETLKGQADALYVVVDNLVVANRTRIIMLAQDAQLPTIFQQNDFVKAGGLMSYGPNIADLSRRAAELVDKILRGTKPTDIPVEQPTKFDLVINLTTAKAIGLTIPESFLSLADEVIE
jgi:putative ABC transport system substrate-binding protein